MSSGETNLIPPNQETENMEVHHHPDIHHKPKKWKEYVIEFAMIFLAVTLGFLAENLREHIAERSKERKYIAAFISNVKDDTAYLNYVIQFDNHLVKGVDSILMLSHADMSRESNRRSFYHFALQYFYNSAAFKSNDVTLQQLKNTGDFKLIEKGHVADSLTKYASDVQNIYSQGDYYNAYFKDILARLDEIYDITLFGDSTYQKDGQMMNKPFPPFRDNNVKLPVLFNKIFSFRIITYSYAENYLKPQLKSAKSLLSFLKKEYGMTD
ncbi:MAG: hypothetical protein C5B59_02225 [Bacteroidetes bacterium]|nr:MAG: hypothetical protein C5B59_02225 [Bacteroidota bacterium]